MNVPRLTEHLDRIDPPDVAVFGYLADALILIVPFDVLRHVRRAAYDNQFGSLGVSDC